MFEEAQERYNHAAVRLEHCILVFGGMSRQQRTLSLRVIWMYNLFTEQWRKYDIVDGQTCPPATFYASATVIGSEIYMFGGKYVNYGPETNVLWKLSRTQGQFTWMQIKAKSDRESPSCRFAHSGWEYANKLWIFGGKGAPLNGHINDQGDYTERGENNQLLCFNPSCQEWTNPVCSGDIPSPRHEHATAIIGDKAWLFGWYSWTLMTDFGDLYQLEMHSLTWTTIHTGLQTPNAHSGCTLTAVSHNLLLLCGRDYSSKSYGYDTWILDVKTASWKKHVIHAAGIQPMKYHTCTLGINASAISIGGYFFCGKDLRQCEHSKEVHLMLEPKSLKQIAIKTIHNQRNASLWQSLPKRLVSLLIFLWDNVHHSCFT